MWGAVDGVAEGAWVDSDQFVRCGPGQPDVAVGSDDSIVRVGGCRVEKSGPVDHVACGGVDDCDVAEPVDGPHLTSGHVEPGRRSIPGGRGVGCVDRV